MKVLSKTYAVVSVLGIWLGLHYTLDAFIVPHPVNVMVYFVEYVIDGVLLKHIFASLWRILLAMLGSVLIGGFLGIVTGSVPIVDRYLTPIVYLFYPVPRVAFLPVFLLLFGLGDESKVLLMIAVASFYVLIPVRDAIKELPATYGMIAQQFGFTRRMWIVEVILPAISPAFFTALKLTLGTSMATLFFAENYATQYGMGYFIMNSWFKSDYIGMYAGIVMLSLVGNLLFDGVSWVQRRVMKWDV